MSTMSNEDIVKQIAETRGNLSMSLQEVLIGAMDRVGGPPAFGELIGDLMMSNEVPINSRVSLMNNYMKLLASFSEKAPDPSEYTEEQIEAEMKDLMG